jgi:hypothetical protein
VPGTVTLACEGNRRLRRPVNGTASRRAELALDWPTRRLRTATMRWGRVVMLEGGCLNGGRLRWGGAGPAQPCSTAYLLEGRGDRAMAKTYRDVATEEMLQTVEEAMRHVINWWGDLPPPMKEAVEQFRIQLGAAIDSVEFVKRALDREVHEREWRLD